MTKFNHLLSPATLGSIAMKNRVVMAPLTRGRALRDGHLPTKMMAEHYAQRASGGLLIAEATMISEGNSAFYSEPGIYSQAQIEAWKEVTDAVHANGGKIMLQIWHGGRACHPLLNEGKPPVAPSALAIENEEVHTPEGKKSYTVPKALTVEEIAQVVQEFKQAAINAKAAGFDGVEVHGANGYLIDQFLRDGANKRDDQYGGSLANRSRFLQEVLAAVTEIWGADKVGLRLSPLNGFNGMSDSDPVALVEHLANELNPLNLAFIHFMRADFKGGEHPDVLSPFKAIYKGHIIANMGYSADEANQAIADGISAIAFGMPFIANPDLVERFANNAPLAEVKAEYLYGGNEVGYTDYPVLES